MARTINEIKSELELIKNSFYEEVEKTSIYYGFKGQNIKPKYSLKSKFEKLSDEIFDLICESENEQEKAELRKLMGEKLELEISYENILSEFKDFKKEIEDNLVKEGRYYKLNKKSN